jgi:predicted alpha/beta-fold hydrolase
MTKHAFKPAWWLPNSHLQTMWPVIFKQNSESLPLRRERIELPDGDFVDLDWCGYYPGAPIVLVLHGFEGSIDSHYAKGMLQSIQEQGWQGVFMHFRGCSGEPNRLQRGYHSGDTSDVAFVVAKLRENQPNRPIAAVGYSLGGNILLKWLGETQANNPLTAAVAISVPFELNKAAKRITKGFSRIYEYILVKAARERLMKKFKQVPSPIDEAILTSIHAIHELDYHYTVPVHGFESVDEYYQYSSSRQYMRHIKVPTLVVHAKDDPFMTEDVIPASIELSSSVTLELTETGGHVGFVSGRLPWKPVYWLEQRVPSFLQLHL